MDRWFERLGFAAQWLAETVRAGADSAADAVADAASEAGEAAEEAFPSLPFGAAPPVLASAATAYLATRLLRPAEVRWSRAVLAGVVGTLLYDAHMALDQRASGRKFDTIAPLGEALTDDPDLQPWAGRAAHYAAGVALAMVYARFLHHRLPGPAAARGALFGAADAATLQWGGLLPLLSRVAPGVPLPPGYSGLAHAPELGLRSLGRHLAYGIGVGLVYGAGSESR